MIRGGIYPVDLGDAKRGLEQRGKRYGLVISIQRDAWSVVTVIPTSTSARAASFRPEIEFGGRTTRLLIDQIRTIDTRYAGELEHYLPRDEMERVEELLGLFLGLE
ncbi:type II toxin-antitoxin system PemK/MazF family toxin [Streptomyces luteolus]|uniref:Type II toxin-antitoxin system PemK/MazF family toxin n=1 Tax=Streptomyces luteolus TaxID=3043615 RepID=A0ABT6T784_9ACTN|nr:type II toxin-antitoxin system PemK/MazF family toxin [Streptomyces sp. B-S-A12]MDI3422874.1 type II toxin-antitoxin system PemK/MazF family toxin [Streptomyces sp. B-S-A12]